MSNFEENFKGIIAAIKNKCFEVISYLNSLIGTEKLWNMALIFDTIFAAEN